jgi:hypothetical protein
MMRLWQDITSNWGWIVAIMIVCLAIKPLRFLLLLLFSAVLMPVIQLVFTAACHWSWYVAKRLWNDLVSFAKHWHRPHRVIYPSLKTRRDRDKR